MSEKKLKPGFNVPARCLVTGGSGFVGRRLVEMLHERGSSFVLSADIVKPQEDFLQYKEYLEREKNYSNVTEVVDEIHKVSDNKSTPSSGVVHYAQVNLAKKEEVFDMVKNYGPFDCIFHIAAIVGPYHPNEVYVSVNYYGTLYLLEAARTYNIKKFVMSSSPSTRFPYPDPNIYMKTVQDLYHQNKGEYAPTFLQPYASSKALGEKVVLEACGNSENDLLTIAVAPHQVYGPRDSLFLPSLLDTSRTNKLRIFGQGDNIISFCYVDNYCHGLICGYEKLYPGSKALGKFYIITDDLYRYDKDGKPVYVSEATIYKERNIDTKEIQIKPYINKTGGIYFWKALDDIITQCKYNSLFNKFKLHYYFIMPLSYLVLYLSYFISFITRVPFHRVNYYLKLNPFSAKMLIIDRQFCTVEACNDLDYEPLVTFSQGWNITCDWFKKNWLVKYQK